MTVPVPEQPPTVAGADTAAPTVEEMAEQLADAKIRSTLGDWEKQLNETMARAADSFAQQQATLQAQIAVLQGQLAAVRQQAGPPEAVVLSASLAQRVKSIANANPDIRPLHFEGVVQQAERLDEAVKAAASGDASTAEAERLANAVITWFTRSHPRVSSKPLEQVHAVLDEAERILEALPELSPDAQAIAAAV